MKRTGRGIPAAAVLANGLSRHGAHCHCRICVDVRAERDALKLDECGTCGAIHTDVDCFGKAVAS